MAMCRQAMYCACCALGRSWSCGRSMNWEGAMTEHATLPRGTKPKGASSEQEAPRKVREMFTRIAPRYDLLNHLLSLELDRVWRARTARILQPILERPEARIL